MVIERTNTDLEEFVEQHSRTKYAKKNHLVNFLMTQRRLFAAPAGVGAATPKHPLDATNIVREFVIVVTISSLGCYDRGVRSYHCVMQHSQSFKFS